MVHAAGHWNKQAENFKIQGCLWYPLLPHPHCLLGQLVRHAASPADGEALSCQAHQVPSATRRCMAL